MPLVDRSNRLGSGDRCASPAVDAAVAINIKLGDGFERGFVFLGMDAIGWARINTEQILDGGIGNYVSHRKASIKRKVGERRRIESKSCAGTIVATNVTLEMSSDGASHSCVIPVTAWITMIHVQVGQTETHVLTPENCPAPLQDPKKPLLSGEPGTFHPPRKLTQQQPHFEERECFVRETAAIVFALDAGDTRVSALTRCSSRPTPSPN